MRLPVVSHRRSTPSGFTRGVRVTVISAAAATAAATLTGAPASADPQDTRESAKAAVDRLYGEAERATERYNEAAERVDRLRGEAERSQDATARGQERVNRMRDALGSMAGAQYRAGAVDPALALLLSGDPDTYLERAAALDRAGARQAMTLDKLRHAQRRLAQTRAETTRALAELERNRAAVTRHKHAVESKLRAARRLLDSLPPEERATFDRASRSGRGEAPDLSGVAPGSGRAMSAVAAAHRALGRPYVWGANGPSGFDCSGLMQWAYAQAGVSLPRTSQAQRYAGRMVPSPRPGPATWSPTGRTPATSACTSATGRSSTPPTRAPRSATIRSA